MDSGEQTESRMPCLVRANSSPLSRNSRPWQVKQMAAASRLARSSSGESRSKSRDRSMVSTSLSHRVQSSWEER